MSITRASSTPSSSSNTTAVASFTISAPTGTVDGDVLLLAVNIQLTGGSVTTPTGWTLAADSGTVSTSQPRLYHFVRVWHTGDPTSWTVSQTSAIYGAVMVGYQGVDQTNPFGAVNTSQNDVSTTTVPMSTITTTRNGSMAIASAGIGSNSTTFTAIPTGFSEAVVTGGKRVDICDESITSSGTLVGSGASWTSSSVVVYATATTELLVAQPVVFVQSNLKASMKARR